MSEVAKINDTLDASVMEIPTINAVGYAVVSSQPGRSENQKRLMAIRSARMAAMRESPGYEKHERENIYKNETHKQCIISPTLGEGERGF